MESKYKIGNKVKVKSIDWYNNNKDRFGSVAIGDKKPRFTYAMSKYCGQVLTVDDLSEYEGEYYMIEDDGVYTWADEMFEGVVDDSQYHPDMSGQYHSDSELDIVDDYIHRLKGNECQIALPEGYQFVDREGNIIDTSIIMVKKKGVEYPKDYDGCCNVLDYDDDKMSLEKMNELRKLINARNAYWKIYGEEMGLGKPWKPDYTNTSEKKFSIWVDFGEIKSSGSFTTTQMVLSFPTEELCEMFYERFKSEIEFCKELI